MRAQILFLHGAGVANKDRYDYLFKKLGNSIQGFTFNFSGHSGLDMHESSLERRYNEAKEAIKSFELRTPLNLIGSSMGGYLAIKLLEEFPVENLFLFCPAVYDIKVFTTPFDKTFTEKIRRKESWKDSDAFDIARKFEGNLVIFIGEKDEVIPKELIQMLEESFENTKSKKIVRIPGATHALGPYIRGHGLTAQVAQEISSFFV